MFLALEGGWARPAGRPGGYSYHIATDAMAMPINLPFEFKFKDGYELRLILDVAKVFGGTHAISVSDTASSTHSRINDPLAGRLRDNLLRA